MKEIQSKFVLRFYRIVAAVIALGWAETSVADYLFTFDVTVNERRTVDSYSQLNAFQANYGQLDSTFTPVTFTTHYLLKTNDLKSDSLWGANTYWAWSSGLSNLNNSLYQGAKPSTPALPVNQDINSEMYVRDAYPSTEASLPKDVWVAASMNNYEQSASNIVSDTSHDNVHTYEYEGWQSRTSIDTKALPEGFNFPPEIHSLDSLLNFIISYQALDGAEFNFSSVGQYDHVLTSTYNPYLMDGSYTTVDHLGFLQVGYVGSAKLTGVSEVPLPSTVGVFLSSLCSLFYIAKKRRT